MPDLFAQARALHASSHVIDMHADTPQRFVDEGWNFTDNDLGRGHISLPTAKEGGLDAEFFAAWVEPHEWKGHYAERTRSLMESVVDQCMADGIALCETTNDIVHAREDDTFAALIGIEGGHSIEARIDLLEEFYTAGARYMTLTWSNTNEWADSSNDVEVHGGLTSFGREVVQRMNALGMMVDISHVSDKTFWDVLRVSKAPVLASHSSCRALTDAPRNLTDEMIRAVADQDGIVCVNFFPAFIDEYWRAQWNTLRDARNAAHEAAAAPYRLKGEAVPFYVNDDVDRAFAAQFDRAPLDALVAHFEHALDLVGPKHVGIGTDFDGIWSLPTGIDSAADLPLLTAALLQRGHSEDDLRLVLGQNVLRVFRAVEEAAKAVF